jgi:phage terminase small subunit
MLNDKQKRFCQEYIIDLNAAQAAIRAGYSKHTARTIGQQLLTKLDAQEYVKELKAGVQEKYLITVDDLMNDLINLKQYGLNEENLTDKEGNLKSRKIDAKTALEAIDKLCRIVGAYEEDNRQVKPEPFKIIIN